VISAGHRRGGAGRAADPDHRGQVPALQLPDDLGRRQLRAPPPHPGQVALHGGALHRQRPVQRGVERALDTAWHPPAQFNHHL
jgi:hypothetical protein